MSRVLAEASAAFYQRAGIGRYSRNIIDRLVVSHPEIAWILFHAPERRGHSIKDWMSSSGARRVTFLISRRRLD